MDIKDYLKRKMAILSLAMARVEKASLNQTSDALGTEDALTQTMNHGSMVDALLKGEMTTEVKDLRWRMYKVLKASSKLKSEIVGYDEDGLPITKTSAHEKQILSNIKVDPYDDYEIELVLENEEIAKSTHEEFSNEKLKVLKENEVSDYEKINDKFDLVGSEQHSGTTLGEISFDDMVSKMKGERKIQIHRELRPKFEIEQHTKKLVVRNIDDETKLLEFYISKYPDLYDKKTKFMVSEIKRAMSNPRRSDMLDIKTVGFITNKAIGCDDGMEYIYEIVNFDKIVEFNGHYVLKFVAKPVINGKFIFEKYKQEDLELRYKNKEAKKLDK